MFSAACLLCCRGVLLWRACLVLFPDVVCVVVFGCNFLYSLLINYGYV
jgi:hypothetical protein